MQIQKTNNAQSMHLWKFVGNRDDLVPHFLPPSFFKRKVVWH